MNQETLQELESRIEEMRHISETLDIDLDDVLETLEQKATVLKEHLYENRDVWERIQLSRNMKRPTTLDYIHEIFDDFIELHGDRLYGDDPAIVGGIATFQGIPVTVIGNQKGKNTKENLHRRFGMSQPEGYRKALRLMQQADKFGRPIITFINTAGAFPGKEAEERGQSEAIARNLREMAMFRVPIICFVIGEGGSGGALALGVGNRLYMLENTFYSVISPEGAASILWKDASKAKQAANSLKVTAQDLYEFGIVDDIVKEPQEGAHTDISLQSSYIQEVLSQALSTLLPLSAEELRTERFQKFRKIGVFQDMKYSVKTNEE